MRKSSKPIWLAVWAVQLLLTCFTPARSTNPTELGQCGYALRQGRRFQMEDRAVCWSPPTDSGISPFSLYAVYDGHEGKEASSFLESQLHTTLLQVLEKANSDMTLSVLSSALNESFFTVDNQFLQMAQHRGLADGSTAVVGVLWGSHLVAANVGNSRALLCSAQEELSESSQLLAVPLTQDHVPSNPGELQRILAAGGRVLSARGKRPRLEGDLEVSRSIGDLAYRGKGLIGQPELSAWKEVEAGDKFLLLASDGVFEVMNDTEVCQHLWARWTGADEPQPTPPPPPPIPLAGAEGWEQQTSAGADATPPSAGIQHEDPVWGCCDCGGAALHKDGLCLPDGMQRPLTLEQELACRIVEEAYNRHSNDNIAVLVVHLAQHSGRVPPPSHQMLPRTTFPAVISNQTNHTNDASDEQGPAVPDAPVLPAADLSADEAPAMLTDPSLSVLFDEISFDEVSSNEHDVSSNEIDSDRMPSEDYSSQEEQANFSTRQGEALQHEVQADDSPSPTAVSTDMVVEWAELDSEMDGDLGEDDFQGLDPDLELEFDDLDNYSAEDLEDIDMVFLESDMDAWADRQGLEGEEDEEEDLTAPHVGSVARLRGQECILQPPSSGDHFAASHDHLSLPPSPEAPSSTDTSSVHSSHKQSPQHEHQQRGTAESATLPSDTQSCQGVGVHGRHCEIDEVGEDVGVVEGSDEGCHKRSGDSEASTGGGASGGAAASEVQEVKAKEDGVFASSGGAGALVSTAVEDGGGLCKQEDKVRCNSLVQQTDGEGALDKAASAVHLDPSDLELGSILSCPDEQYQYELQEHLADTPASLLHTHAMMGTGQTMGHNSLNKDGCEELFLGSAPASLQSLDLIAGLEQDNNPASEDQDEQAKGHGSLVLEDCLANTPSLSFPDADTFPPIPPPLPGTTVAQLFWASMGSCQTSVLSTCNLIRELAAMPLLLPASLPSSEIMNSVAVTPPSQQVLTHTLPSQAESAALVPSAEPAVHQTKHAPASSGGGFDAMSRGGYGGCNGRDPVDEVQPTSTGTELSPVTMDEAVTRQKTLVDVIGSLLSDMTWWRGVALRLQSWLQVWWRWWYSLQVHTDNRPLSVSETAALTWVKGTSQFAAHSGDGATSVPTAVSSQTAASPSTNTGVTAGPATGVGVPVAHQPPHASDVLPDALDRKKQLDSSSMPQQPTGLAQHASLMHTIGTEHEGLVSRDVPLVSEANSGNRQACSSASAPASTPSRVHAVGRQPDPPPSPRFFTGTASGPDTDNDDVDSCSRVVDSCTRGTKEGSRWGATKLGVLGDNQHAKHPNNVHSFSSRSHYDIDLVRSTRSLLHSQLPARSKRRRVNTDSTKRVNSDSTTNRKYRTNEQAGVAGVGLGTETAHPPVAKDSPLEYSARQGVPNTEKMPSHAPLPTGSSGPDRRRDFVALEDRVKDASRHPYKIVTRPRLVPQGFPWPQRMLSSSSSATGRVKDGERGQMESVVSQPVLAAHDRERKLQSVTAEPQLPDRSRHWNLGHKFGAGHFGEVWKGVRREAGSQSDPYTYVLKRIMAEKGPEVRQSGLREAYYGKLLARHPILPDTDGNNTSKAYAQLKEGYAHISRFVEAFQTHPNHDLWLVFRHEGTSLHSLMYEPQGSTSMPGAGMRAGEHTDGTEDGRENGREKAGKQGHEGESRDGGKVPSQKRRPASEQEKREREREARGQGGARNDSRPGEENSGAEEGVNFQVLGPSRWWWKMRTADNGDEVIRQLLKQLLLALHAVHENNITHRDVKPENLLLADASLGDPTRMWLRLIDFGSAVDVYTLEHLYGDKGPSNDELTLEYAAPEALFGRHWQGKRAVRHVWAYDVWSVGVVWLELLTGGPHVFQITPATQAALNRKLSLKSRSEGERQLAYLLRGMMELCIYPPQIPSTQRGRREGSKLLMSWSCGEEELLRLLASKDPTGLGLPGVRALRLLQRLLHWDPGSRPTPRQALQHAYFVAPEGERKEDKTSGGIKCASFGEPGWC